MAPALSTSNSFHVGGAGLRINTESRRTHAAVSARQGLFGLGDKQPSEGTEPRSAAGGGTAKRSPFFVDFPGAKALIPAVSAPSSALLATRRRKDPQTVFVAGATGQAGVRIAQTLLRRGFSVRAGVPDLAVAQELARTAAAYKVISPAESRRLNAVESTFGDIEAIAKSIGPANKVVVTIGPSEKGPGAGDVSTDDALRVVRAADLAGVGHVVVVYDGATGALDGQYSTYNVLDGLSSFFSNLFSRSQQLTLSEFLTSVAATGVSYTLLKAALTEDYAPESSYALLLAQEGTVPDQSATKVSKSQIASLVADVFANTAAAENKVVQVSTSSLATSKPVAQLLSEISEDGRRQEIRAAQAKAREEASQNGAPAASTKQNGMNQEEDTTTASKERRMNDGARSASTDEALVPLLSQARLLGGDFSWEKLRSQFTAGIARPGGGADVAEIATTRGQAKAKKLPAKRAIVRSPAAKPAKPSRRAEPKPEVRKVLGFFKQETIYVDDD